MSNFFDQFDTTQEETTPNFFDKFDESSVAPTTEKVEDSATESNFFDQFDATSKQEPMEFPEQDMDALDTDSTWIKNAAIIYKAEEGEDWKGSNKSLAEWFKDRHSKLNFNITNMGLTAYDTKDMSDDTKQAWIESITQYDNADGDLYAFGRGLKHATVTDPVFWASLVGGVGVGGIAKAFGSRAATQAGKMLFKDQLVKSLTERGVTEAVAKEVVKKGYSKEISKEVLEEGAKAASKNKTKNVAMRAGAVEAAYAGLADLGDQAVDIGLDFDVFEYNNAINSGMSAEDAREAARKSSIDGGQLGAMALAGGVLGGAFGFGLSKLSDKRQIKKLAAQADIAEKAAEQPRVSNFFTEVTEKTSERDITDQAAKAQSELELGGTIEIDISASRTAVQNEIKQLKRKASQYKRTVAYKKKSKKAKENWQKSQNKKIKERQDFLKNQDKNIEKNFSNANIRVQKVGDDKFVGEKILESVELKEIDALNRTPTNQRIISTIKKYVFDDSGLGKGFKALRIRKNAAYETIKRNIVNRQKKLEKAIKKDYGLKLTDVPKGTYSILNSAFAGNQDAIESLTTEAPNVLRELQGMRANIKSLQDDLLNSGALEKDSELKAKIIKSMDGTNNSELHVVRQYEVFDNPQFGRILNDTPEGKEVMKKAQNYFSIEYANKDKKFEQAKKLKDEGVQLTDEQEKIYNDYLGENGIVANTIAKILQVQDEDALFTFVNNDIFDTVKVGKELTKRKDIPEAIRNLMGEYKDPFTNYANTASKLYQTAETYKYEKGIADLIEAGEIAGAVKGIPDIASGITRNISDASRLPTVTGLEKPFDTGIVKPLEDFYATNDVAEAIANGNELSIDWPKPFQKYLLFQGHTRAAKTIYSPTAIARNFIGAAWMALGAGYINPREIKQVYRIFKSLYNQSDDAIVMDKEKGLALGFLQSGTDLGSFKGALKDAGEPEFWNLNSKIYQSEKQLVRSAKKFNTTAVQLYQSMDDMWKQYAFMNEKGNLKQVLIDTLPKGQKFDDVVRSFQSSTGETIEITRLDEAAAAAVNDHMQNYANVPKFVKSVRISPFADFLAFKSEIIRTQKNILRNAINDIKQGREQMKEAVLDPNTGRIKGQAQRNLGYKRLGSMIAAQAAGPGLALGSAQMFGLNETLPGQEHTIKEGIESTDPDYNKGANYIYYGQPEKGKGKRVNVSYINPWATTQAPIVAAITGLNRTGDYVEGEVNQAFNDAVIRPIAEAFGPSMLADSIFTLFRNKDEYGRPIFDKDRFTDYQNLMNGVGAVFGPFEPGAVKSARDLVTSFNLGPDKEFGIKEKGRKIDTTDQLWGLTGVKPEEYDIKIGLNYKMYDLKNRMGNTSAMFRDAYQRRNPITVNELVDTYEQSLARNFAIATEMFDYISKAKSAGLNNAEIYKAITDDGLFKSRMDKNILYNMINKGVFVPPPPLKKDVYKWGISTQRMTGQKPPIDDAQEELMNVYRSYVGATTGVR